MPMQDWTKVEAGTYHNFHLQWIAALAARLNRGCLPKGYFAMAERVVNGNEPDVLTFVNREIPRSHVPESDGDVLVKPRTTYEILMDPEAALYARRTSRISVRKGRHRVTAVIELVSPGNKSSRRDIDQFVKKNAGMLQDGISLMIIDPFPPGTRDPDGIHPLICEQFIDLSFKLPKRKRLTVVSYQTLPELTGFLTPFAVGDRLPEMPLFFNGRDFVMVPLEETYQATCDVIPEELRAP